VSEQEQMTPGGWTAWIEDHVWAMDPRALRALCQQAADGRIVGWMEQYAEQRGREREERVAAETIDRIRALDALGDLSPTAFRAIEGAINAARAPGRPKAIRGSVAQVSLKGVLAPPPPFLAWLFDLEHPLVAFERNVKTALADPDVGAVIVEVDSPGGQVDGVPEAAAMLRGLRGSKPIVAVSNTMAASAAYWLAAQADEVSVTPSGASERRSPPLAGWATKVGAVQSPFEMALISVAETHTTMGRRHAMAVFCAKRTTACASS